MTTTTTTTNHFQLPPLDFQLPGTNNRESTVSFTEDVLQYFDSTLVCDKVCCSHVCMKYVRIFN